ncbi:MAG: fatty acid desaturase [Geminicoccaceae bacterium]
MPQRSFSSDNEAAPAVETDGPPGRAMNEKEWARKLASYRSPKLGRGLFELGATALPFLTLWAVMLIGVKQGYWPSLILIPPAAAFLVRLFMIQHDCGHGSFFKKRWTNDMLGRVIGVLTFTPYADWHRAHAKHHAGSGNLDRRGTGDIDLLTVAEYKALPFKRRLTYRLSRNAFVLLVIAPVYVFILRQRLPNDLLSADRDAWVSTLSTNVAIVALMVGVGLLVGFGPLLLVQIPVTLIASAIGIWLFYVQHQFEHTYWARENEWTFHEGAMHGSTHYDLPAPFRWLTGNIGIHHVHHLVSRIPSYRLNEALRDHPELRDIGRLTFLQSLKCFRLALWDERNQRLVGFRQASALT